MSQSPTRKPATESRKRGHPQLPERPRKRRCAADRFAAYDPVIVQLAAAANAVQQARQRCTEAESKKDKAYQEFAMAICLAAQQLYKFETSQSVD